MENILDRFLRYVVIDTTSKHGQKEFPSTEKQLTLLRLLHDELKNMGIEDVSIDEYGYVMASIPSNIEKDVPPIGFLAHADTSPDSSGTNVKPQVIKSYDGSDIVLNKDMDIVLRTKDFPEIKEYIGQTIITTDGTTLLGADNKAGVAEIMYVAEYLMNHPEVEHGEIKIGFTPDEEVGRGVDFFNVEKFGAKYAYTIDGGRIGELEYENFNAAYAKITIQGCNIHPGYAKNKMLNAIHIGHELNSLLPINLRPEYTEAYEGFFHLTNFNGSVEKASVEYIIREHDLEKFVQMKDFLFSCGDFINNKYGNKIVTIEIEDNYYNMKEKIVPHYHIIEVAIEAIRQAGIEPIIKPIRGGTDGARLSYMGLPCPNIFTGGHNFHGKYEYIPLESMEKASNVILNLIKLFAC